MYRIPFFVVFVYHGFFWQTIWTNGIPPKRMPNGPSWLRFVRQQNSLQDQRVVYKILKPSCNLVCIRRGTVSTGWYPHCPLWSTLTILSAPLNVVAIDAFIVVVFLHPYCCAHLRPPHHSQSSISNKPKQNSESDLATGEVWLEA